MKKAQNFLASFKKKKLENLKRTKIITPMRGVPPRNTSLFTLKYFQ